MESFKVENLSDLSLHELIETLLEETFAKDSHFERMNFEEIGELLEEQRERFERVPLETEAAEQKPSYERSVGIYCLLLMRLEQRGSSLSPSSLGELLAKNDQKTNLIRATISAPIPEPPRPKAAFPAFPPVSLPRESAKEDPPSPPATTATAAPAIEPQLTGRGKQYLEMADYFKTLRGGSCPLPQSMLNKLIGQGLCFALEAEGVEKMERAIKQFWPQREMAIRALLDPASRKFELHPMLKKSIDAWAASHTEWLSEGDTPAKFPYPAVLSSLRYLLALLQPERHQLTLIEMGMLVLFFGQAMEIQGLVLNNFLGASGLSKEETLQFMLRMSRLNRLKSKVVSPTHELDDAHLQILEADVKALRDLFALLQFNLAPSAELKVA